MPTLTLTRRFGFRKNRPTVDAIKAVVDAAAAAIEGERWLFGSEECCSVVTMDIRNAFNSADWRQIQRVLTRMQAPTYLTRIVGGYFNTSNFGNEATAQIKRWLESVGLELADHKTDAVLITGRKIADTMTIQVGKERIVSKRSLKYLGVMLDDRLSFKRHIEYCSEKASRMMPNIGGPKQERRQQSSKLRTTQSGTYLSRSIDDARSEEDPDKTIQVIGHKVNQLLLNDLRRCSIRSGGNDPNRHPS